MPLYEYECPRGHKYEKVKSIKERKHDSCPHCGGTSNLILSTCNWSFGWVLSERSHKRFGPREEWVKNVGV